MAIAVLKFLILLLELFRALTFGLFMTVLFNVVVSFLNVPIIIQALCQYV